jgi:Flp pilus assembly protein CpaB
VARIVTRQTLTVGILAVLVGLVVAYSVRSYLSHEELPVVPPPAPRPVQVPLASADLPADRVISQGDIALVAMTRQQIAQRFKGTDPDQILMSPQGIIGRRLKEPLTRGNPFLTARLYLDGEGPNIAKKLPPGFRAVRIKLSDTHDGGVQAGGYVDVVFRASGFVKAGLTQIPEKTVTLLRHIEVLEVEYPKAAAFRGTVRASTERGHSLITLAVPEDKADFFSIVEGRGELWLVPRPTQDSGQGVTSTVSNASTLAELLGLKPVAKPTPEPPPFQTAIYRGTSYQLNSFVNGQIVGGGGTGGSNWGGGSIHHGLPPPWRAREREYNNNWYWRRYE